MTATRSVNTTDRPAAGTWTVDPGHAEVGFVGRHFGLTKVRGRFTGVEGTVVVGDELTASSIDVAIDMASVSSGDQSRDDHLRSADFFDVERHPRATFHSDSVVASGSSGSIPGELTIKGITRPVTLEVEYLGHVTDPWGAQRAVFSAGATINRELWDLTWNVLLEAGGLLVSKEIRLEIEVELVLQDRASRVSTRSAAATGRGQRRSGRARSWPRPRWARRLEVSPPRRTPHVPGGA
jgi:polyisoprenoid-binding protein YceI